MKMPDNGEAPQRANASRLVSTILFDLWAERWRRREATGDMIMIRYADDLVVGFQRERDARRFWDAMRDRLREFSLSLHPDKNRLIEFGRFAAQNCKRCGRSKPETFKFLGFVLICDKSRRGDFRIRRKSRQDRMRTKLREIKEALQRRTNRPIPETGKWLAQVVAGYFAYHAVPTNGLALAAFRHHVAILWHRQLCRRSQRARLVWTQMAKLADDMSSSRRRRSFIRGPACGSPLDTQGRSRVPELGSLGSVRGALRNERPLYVASVRQMIISAGWRGKR